MQIIVVFLLFLIYAIFNEIKDHTDSYANGIPLPSDGPRKLLYRLKILTKSETTCVKWRRAYIATIIGICFYCFFHRYVPGESELISLVIAFFVSIYSVMQIHALIDYNKCQGHVQTCLHSLRKVLTGPNRS
jgi:hypothetical protein